MNLPFLQSLTPQQQKLILFIGGGLTVTGFLAILAGIFFNPSAEPTRSGNTSEQTATTTLTPGAKNTPAPTQQKVGSSESDVTAYPTPTPTPNGTLKYFKDALPTDIPNTPTPTPLKGTFYTPNGKQNDLTIRLWRYNDWDILDEVQLINTNTKEIRPIGQAYDASPGDSAFFSNNFSSVIFIGSKKTDPDYEKISFYSIPQNKITKQISLANMKKAMAGLQIEPTAVLSRLVVSPNGNRAAFSYGKTFNVAAIDPNTFIVLLDLSNDKLTLRPEKGLVNSWRDDTTLLYEPTPGNIQEIKL